MQRNKRLERNYWLRRRRTPDTPKHPWLVRLMETETWKNRRIHEEQCVYTHRYSRSRKVWSAQPLGPAIWQLHRGAPWGWKPFSRAISPLGPDGDPSKGGGDCRRPGSSEHWRRILKPT